MHAHHVPPTLTRAPGPPWLPPQLLLATGVHPAAGAQPNAAALQSTAAARSPPRVHARSSVRGPDCSQSASACLPGPVSRVREWHSEQEPEGAQGWCAATAEHCKHRTCRSCTLELLVCHQVAVTQQDAAHHRSPERRPPACWPPALLSGQSCAERMGVPPAVAQRQHERSCMCGSSMHHGAAAVASAASFRLL